MKYNFFVVLLWCLITSSISAQSYWKKSTNSARRAAAITHSKKPSHLYFRLDKQAFDRAVSSSIVQIPDAEGVLVSYRLTPTQILSANIAHQNPTIQTFVGQALDNPHKHISLVWTPFGLSGTITQGGTYAFIDAEDQNGEFYKVYYRQDSQGSITPCNTPWCTPVLAESHTTSGVAHHSPHARTTYQTENKMYTIRLAIACTAAFTKAAGGTKSQAYAEVVKTVNRINTVYGTQMSVKLQLVTSTEMIYDNLSTDPTKDFNFGTAWDTPANSKKLQDLFDSSINTANYDIGHLFHKGDNNGNAAAVKAILMTDWKARAYSMYAFSGDRDIFDIDIVAHEIGHQLGATHTFSYLSEKDSNNHSQVEPGSASTIMGYAGIAGTNNVQLRSDPYFHHCSVYQITNVLSSLTSGVIVTTHTNAAPTFNEAHFNDYTIPQGTAFVLSGSATDTTDNLLYTWEQADDYSTAYSSYTSAWIPAYRFSGANTTGAIARSLPPSDSPVRYIPQLSRIVSGNLTDTTNWETVSTVGRTMHWSLVVTDRAFLANQIGNTAYKTITVTVDSNAGPFVVTSHAHISNWVVGNTVTLTWEVANTNLAPISAEKVDILFSTNGGQTFSYTLAEGVPNSGIATLIVPSHLITKQGRYMIKASGNIFLAVNAANIVVSQRSEGFLPHTLPDGPILMSNAFTPNNDGINDTYVIARSEDFPNNTLQVYNSLGQLVYEAEGYKNQWDGTMSNGKRVARGSYMAIFSKDGSEANKQRSWVYINY